MRRRSRSDRPRALVAAGVVLALLILASAVSEALAREGAASAAGEAGGGAGRAPSTPADPGATAAEPALEAAPRRASVEDVPPDGGDAADAETPAPAYSLHGRIVVRDGGPFEPWSALVLATDGDGNRHPSRAETGAYAIDGLHAGSWSLGLVAVEFQAEPVTVELTPEDPAREMDIPITRKPVIAVALLDDEGRPLVDAMREAGLSTGGLLVVATREAPPSPFRERAGVSPNEKRGIGNWWGYGPLVDRLEPPYDSIIALDEPPPAFVSLIYATAVVVSVAVAPGDATVELRVSVERLAAQLASVHVRVVDAEDGAGLPAMVEMSPAGGGAPSSQGTCAPDGGLELSGLLPGPFRLTAHLEGYAGEARRIDVQPGATSDLGEIALRRPAELRLRFVDPDGRPVVARVDLYEADGPRLVRPGERALDMTGTDADGRIRMVVGDGDYLVRVVPDTEISFPGRKYETPFVSGYVLVHTRPGEPEEETVRLQPACSLVVDPGDRPELEGLSFAIDDDAGRRVVASPFWFEGVQSQKLAAGNYTVVLLDADHVELERKRVALTPAGAAVRF